MHTQVPEAPNNQPGVFQAMVEAMSELRNDSPFGPPDTRTREEVHSQWLNGLPSDQRNRYMNQKRRSDKARKAAKKARKRNRR